MGFVYLASPYTHTDPWIREERYLRACRVLCTLLKNGIHTYSPIVHCHEIAKVDNLPREEGFWRAYNFGMLAASDSLMVCRIEGWDISVGVKAEIEEANRLSKKVTYI